MDLPRTLPEDARGATLPAPARLLPFFFGPPERRLFGLLHPPRGAPRERGVLLCGPFGHEALRFHRALGQLAQHLAGAGLVVLRFDPFGTGDSAGGDEDLRLDGWEDDILRALDELRARDPTLRAVDVVGLRLGATLALRAAARRGGVRRLVLWDAVPDGRTHLAELEALHRTMLRVAHVRPTPAEARGEPRQLLGFTLAPELIEQLAAFDLADVDRRPAERVLLLESHPDAQPGPLRARLAPLVPLDEQRRPARELWRWQQDASRQLVPLSLLQEIVAWLA